jgi:hypothetical protein
VTRTKYFCEIAPNMSEIQVVRVSATISASLVDYCFKYRKFHFAEDKRHGRSKVKHSTISLAKPTLCLMAGSRQRLRFALTSHSWDGIIAEYCSTLEESLVPQLKRMVFKTLSFTQGVVG